MTFRDTAPHNRMAEPTRAECDAADEAYWQEEAGIWGNRCLDVAQELVEQTDRYAAQWGADNVDRIKALHGALMAALSMAQEIKP
jgi:hypothetical protein